MNYPFKEIRSHYEVFERLIFKCSEKHPTKWASPYCGIDWIALFTPIEDQTWQAIRCYGKVPLYPQYPVGNYFIDFANPVYKVGIECDGKEWHTDKEKDGNRDLYLFKMGWTIFRIPGKDCFKQSENYFERYDYEEEENYEILKIYYSTIEGLLKAIGTIYFGQLSVDYKMGELDLIHECILEYLSPVQKVELQSSISQAISEISYKLHDD